MLSRNFVIGVAFSLVLRLAVFVRAMRPTSPSSSGFFTVENTGREPHIHVTDENLLLIGILTAAEFLPTRVVAAYDTWGSSVPGKVLFFSSEGSSLPSRPDIPIVALPGITDEYPPQRKSFAMLQYMYDHYRDKFRYFMRADDDLYVRGDILGRFLHSINSTGRALFIGQPGFGNPTGAAVKHLLPDENYCMGGPGVFLSRETLIRVAPHIDCCARHMVTPNEDVEIGRCIFRFTGTKCTTNYEMKDILFHNYVEPKGSFTGKRVEYLIGPLPDTHGHQPVTLHPVKLPAYQYRLHKYMMSRDSYGLRKKIYQFQRRINEMNMNLESDTKGIYPNSGGLQSSLRTPMESSADKEWEFLDNKRLIYSSGHSNPMRKYEQDVDIAERNVLNQIMNAGVGSTYDVKKQPTIEYAYRRLHPLLGVDYVLFLDSQASPYSTMSPKRPTNNGLILHIRQPFLEPEFRTSTASTADSECVNFVVPLTGRHETLCTFMDNFEASCLSGERPGTVSLTVVVFHEKGEVEQIVNRLELTRSRYPGFDVRIEHVVDGPFSRGRGLQRGAELQAPGALLFFIDVDMRMRSDLVRRARLNTVRRRRVFYPIVQGRYDHRFKSRAVSTLIPGGIESSTAALDSDTFEDDAGKWRLFGYGMIAVYREDFFEVGGFDLTIKGWGFEDVRLYERFLAHNLTLFRAVDVGLVHRFHEMVCDVPVDQQNKMCIASKQSTLASAGVLAAYVRATPEIYLRDVPSPSNPTSINNSSSVYNSPTPVSESSSGS